MGKQSSPDRSRDEHLHSHDRVEAGEGEAKRPVKVTGGEEDSWAGRSGYGVVEGPTVEGPAHSGAPVDSSPSASNP